jgi:hypothetical protein
VAGLAAPLLPTYLVAHFARVVGVDDAPSVAYGIFGFGALVGGVAAGYVAESDAVFYGIAVGLSAAALIVIGTFVNGAIRPTSVLTLSGDRLVWIGLVVIGGATLGARFGEIRTQREAVLMARKAQAPDGGGQPGG